MIVFFFFRNAARLFTVSIVLLELGLVLFGLRKDTTRSVFPLFIPPSIDKEFITQYTMFKAPQSAHFMIVVIMIFNFYVFSVIFVPQSGTLLCAQDIWSFSRYFGQLCDTLLEAEYPPSPSSKSLH